MMFRFTSGAYPGVHVLSGGVLSPAGVVSAIHQGSLMSSSPHGKVLCADCGKAYRWQAELAGKKVRCTRCEGVMLFPTDAPGLDKTAKATMRSHGKAAGENARPTDKPGHATDSAARPTAHSTSSDSTDMTGAPGISGVAEGGAAASGGGLVEPAGSSSLPIDEELGIDLDLDLDAPAPGEGDMIDIRAAEETPSAPGSPTPGAAAKAAAPSAGESAEKVCPSCKAALSANAVLCVKCGFNLKKGKATTSNLDGNSGGLLSRLTRGWRKGGA